MESAREYLRRKTERPRPESIREYIKKNNSVILSHHGSITVGETLEETLIALERMEHAAYTYFLAHELGDTIPLPSDELERLQKIGVRIRSKD